jgi:hypothetical protein
MNRGRTLFAQLIALLPRRAFDSAIRRYDGQTHVQTFSCMDQLLCMVFAQLTFRSSLRETVTCLQALGARRYHCGIRGPVARSTLADANELRDFRIFQDLALAMIAAARLELPVDADLAHFAGDVYALDSTTIDLCMALFPWALFRRRKSAVKAHVLYDLRAGIPVFMRVSHGKTHDNWMLDQITPEAGAHYVLDKGYLDFVRLYHLHTAGAFFITRARRDLHFGVRERRTISAQGPVTSDRIIRLRGIKTRKRYPDTLRLVGYRDPVTGRHFTFLTNNLTLDAVMIAMLYRKRWQIELFFKWIKQHLHITAFFGLTPNAIKTQLWIAVIVYVLVTKFKHRHQLPQTQNEVLQILSVTFLQKSPVNEVFSNETPLDGMTDDHNQLPLFGL